MQVRTTRFRPRSRVVETLKRRNLAADPEAVMNVERDRKKHLIGHKGELPEETREEARKERKRVDSRFSLGYSSRSCQMGESRTKLRELDWIFNWKV